MLLKSITIENFQQYEKPFQLTGLSSGINVIYGDNEAGKSTLLRALRAILFDRFNGKGADDFVGYKGGSPEVRIEFDLCGNHYSLEKIFSKKKEGRAVLSNDQGIQWTGTEAEIQLAELLKFENVERGLSKLEQQGIYGALWVEQGNAWRQVSITNNQKASQTIQNVLNHELTNMLSQGKGESLLKKFADELNGYQTEKGGKPRGEYKEKLAAKSQAEQKLKELSNELNSYQNKVDQLSDLEKELSTFVNDNVEEKDKKQLEHAERHLREVKEVDKQYKQCIQDLKVADLKLKDAERALIDRKTVLDTLSEETKSHNDFESKIVELEAENEQLKIKLDEAKKNLTQAKSVHIKNQSATKIARSYQKLIGVQDNVKRIDAQLKKIHDLNVEIKKKKNSFSKILLDNVELKKLKTFDDQVKSLQMKLETIATHVEYSIQENNVKIDDKSVLNSGELLISDRSTISFGNSHIFITPGGDELSTVQDKLSAAKSQRSAAFEQYNITSISQAEYQVEKKNTLLNEITSLNNQAVVIAPNGIESLEQELAENQSEETRLKSLVGETKSISIEQAEEQEASSDAELSKCSDNERYAHDQLVTKEAALKHAKASLSTSKEKLKVINNKLILVRKEHSDNELSNTVQCHIDEKQQLQGKLTNFENTLKDLDVEGAKSEVERRDGVLKTTQNRIANLKQQIRDLNIELQTCGHRGLAEEKEQAEQELKDVCHDVDRLYLHVGSLNLLCQLIKESIQSAKEMLVKPITESMAPYLKILFPDSKALIDEEFTLQYILRDGVREPFENLSIGTREQLAILLRLAYADILAEKGAAVPLILDDALVNTDDDRREKMKMILHRASQKHQIIILTCHGNDYRDCGGVYKNIAIRNNE